MSTAPPPDREPETSSDELLELGGHRHRHRGGRRWWLAAALVVAAAVAVVSARLSSSHDRAAAPASASAPAPVSVSVSARSDSVPSRTVPSRVPCRGIAGCVARSTVPAGIAALARARLSPDVVLQVRTFVVAGSASRSSRLIERDVTAYYRSATVVIRVDHGSDVTSALTPDPPGTGSLLLHRTAAGFAVRLQYLAPETVPPVLTDLLALIRDPQLTST